ncbi:MAG: hypothetical protein HZA47_10055 [Planctomycetes bacterium]|uniref:retron St85 family effector protein n=1 Tax=Candidatus Wunengus sp. YC65 TaxID=3367701 RepID=UPI001D5EC9CE|nr:hypothetical protein [Planctomycetota bacterium]
MTQTDDISKAECKKLSIKIRDDIFKPVNTYKTTIFLCGADLTQKDKIRYKIDKVLRNWWYSIQYDIIYPEDIFEELLYSSQTKDLLSLENLLAESTDAVVLIPESPGSFTELGAFANDEKVRNKLICIIDEKYKKNKSFINQGPLKLVKKANKHALIFINPNEIDKEVDKLNTSLKKMKKSSSKRKDKITLLQIHNFLLPSIFLLEPVSKRTLINLVGNATEEDEVNSFQTTTAALTILTNKRQVELTPNGYKLTQLGVKDFLSFRKTSSRMKTQRETVAIDELRLEILNLKNRKKKLKV